MTELPGLGGNNSIGAGDNDLGQVVGWAEKNVVDPTCAPPIPGATQFLQFEATLWQRDRSGAWRVLELPPYPGDPDGAATAINDLGQADGTITPLNSLIGSATANWDISSTGGINDRGVIAAQANIVSNGVVTSAADAVLLVPSAPDDPVAYGETHKTLVPEDVRKQMHERANVGHFRLRVTAQ